MSKGAHTKRERGGVVADGGWLPVSCAFLSSRACAELSPHAAKMLMFFLGQLKPGGYGNGRLDADEKRLRAYGWTSEPTARAAIRELIAAGLLVCTRKGVKGRIGLYGVTLLPMQCEHGDLEHGPGAWTVTDWRTGDETAKAPTLDRPAVHRAARYNEADKKRNRSPRGGSALPQFTSAAEVNATHTPSCTSAAEADLRVSAMNSLPPRAPPSRTPSIGQQRTPLPCHFPAALAA